jgi:hypothetical protein
MRPGAIELHIEELVLRGFGPLDRPAIAAAVEAELGRLLLTSDLRYWHVAAGSRPSVDGGEFVLEGAASTTALGSSIAAAVHTSLTGVVDATRGSA